MFLCLVVGCGNIGGLYVVRIPREGSQKVIQTKASVVSRDDLANKILEHNRVLFLGHNKKNDNYTDREEATKKKREGGGT